MTPTSNVNFSNLNARLFTMNAFSNVSIESSNPFGIFGGQLNLGNFNFGTTPTFDFSKMFGNLSGMNFNFNFSNIGSTSTQYTATSGNQKASAKAEGLNKQFLDRVKQIATKIGCDYKDLLGVMHSESGLNSKAQNSKGGAAGLIQFLPSTARELGTTTDALRNMSAVQQLDYVEKFLIMVKNRSALRGKTRLSAGDLYTLVFMPAKAGGEVITSAGSRSYAANKGLDANGDGMITKTELGNRVISNHVNESIFA